LLFFVEVILTLLMPFLVINHHNLPNTCGRLTNNIDYLVFLSRLTTVNKYAIFCAIKSK